MPKATGLSIRIAAVLAGVLLLGTTAQAAVVPRDGVSGFFSYDDNMLHAIVAQTNGDIREIFWTHGSSQRSTALLGHSGFTNIVASTGYYTGFDGYRHAVFATALGQVWAYDYHPQFGSTLNYYVTFPVATYGKIVSMTSYVTYDDGYEHIVVATDQRKVWHYRYNVYVPNSGSIQPVGLQYPSVIVSISAVPYYTWDGAFMYVSTSSSSQGGNFVTMESNTGTWNLPTTMRDDTGYPEFPVITKMIDLGGHTSWATPHHWGQSSMQVNGLAGGPIYQFTYGPSVAAFGVLVEPDGTQHGLTAMSNGDIWNMMRINGSISWTYLGTF